MAVRAITLVFLASWCSVAYQRTLEIAGRPHSYTHDHMSAGNRNYAGCSKGFRYRQVDLVPLCVHSVYCCSTHIVKFSPISLVFCAVSPHTKPVHLNNHGSKSLQVAKWMLALSFVHTLRNTVRG